LKGERCGSSKCALTRRPYRPGMHGKKRKNISEYGHQLLEKQKIKYSYGLNETQIKKIFQEALKSSANIKDFVIKELESRLDNVAFKLGFAPSRRVARQLISHGHIAVNNKKVKVPSYKVNIGDVISIRPQSKNITNFKDLENNLKKYQPPTWLFLDKEKMEGKVLAFPQEVDGQFDINVVVDYYAR
jgi:small subunit ribosomal protein S4